MSTPIDLSLLPLPAVAETLDFESLLERRKADLIAQFPADDQAAIADVLALESEPLTRHLQENTYRELILRQRINEAAAAGMLAANHGADLDGVAARYETLRLPGESDERLRARTQMAFYQVAAAGPANGYRRAGLDAHANVVAVDAWQQSPGVVRVAVLSREEIPSAGAAAIDAAIGMALFGAPESGSGSFVPGQPGRAGFDAARARLTSDDIQPLGVDLQVSVPLIATYSLHATIVVPRGPDPQSVLLAAEKQVQARVLELASFRVDIHRTALIEALMAEGARTVELASPAQDIPRGPGEIAVCTDISLEVVVRDD